MEKARMEREGTLGNKGVGGTKLKDIIKQDEPIEEIQGLGTGLKRISTANSAPTASPPWMK
jgi:hypothetical protein